MAEAVQGGCVAGSLNQPIVVWFGVVIHRLGYIAHHLLEDNVEFGIVLVAILVWCGYVMLRYKGRPCGVVRCPFWMVTW